VLMIQSIASLELVHTLYATANNNCKLVQSRLHQRVRVLQAPHPLRRQRLLHQPRRPKSPTCLSPRYCHQRSLSLSLSPCLSVSHVEACFCTEHALSESLDSQEHLCACAMQVIFFLSHTHAHDCYAYLPTTCCRYPSGMHAVLFSLSTHVVSMRTCRRIDQAPRYQAIRRKARAR
jgi:hypothetical protein